MFFLENIPNPIQYYTVQCGKYFSYFVKKINKGNKITVPNSDLINSSHYLCQIQQPAILLHTLKPYMLVQI